MHVSYSTAIDTVIFSIAPVGGFIGVAIGSALTVSTYYGSKKLSKWVEKKEQESPPGSWQATGFKVSRWAISALNGVLKVSGYVLAGAGALLAVGSSIGLLSFGRITIASFIPFAFTIASVGGIALLSIWPTRLEEKTSNLSH